MIFDNNNKIVGYCSQGMQLEGEGKNAEALALFQQAWDEAGSDFERFTAAHYIARHQTNVIDKLKWEELALNLALKINDDELKGTYPSLYLNVAKCYEDLNVLDKAQEYYKTALSFTNFLSDDGYGKLIRSGIDKGLARIEKQL